MLRLAGVIGLILSSQLHAIEGGKPADHALMLKTGTVAVLFQSALRVDACTGVRVASDIVLTAAHCVVKKSPLGVRQALNHLDESVPMEEIAQVFMPLNNYYNRKYFYPDQGDVAVLVLKKESSAPFLRIKAFSKGQRQFFQLGYGQISLDSRQNSELKYLEDAKVTLNKGAHTLDVVNSLKTGVRPGDSGGPLLSFENGEYYVTGTLIGSESYSYQGKPRGSTYNATASYLTWIRKALSDRSFQNQLKAKKPQYETDDFPAAISDGNRASLLDEACQEMSVKYPVKWELNKYFSCLPQERKMCFEVKSGRFGIGEMNFRLEWDEESGRCAE